MSRVAAIKDRAPQRLPAPRWLSVVDGELKGLDRLPEPPPLPGDFDQQASLDFAGCANLMMYTLGAALALQRSSGSDSNRWLCRGASSGAFMAAAFAMGLDFTEILLTCYSCFVEERCRWGGCIGLYSTTVRRILHQAIHSACAAGKDPLGRAKGHMDISVTSFRPLPGHEVVTDFESIEEVLDAVLASCYIPVAYEDPVVVRGLGLCIDGCAMHFLPNATCVVSPYHCHSPDVCPAHEYPGAMVFSLLHGADTLRLFEDGYLDCVEWLKQGAPSKESLRASVDRGARASIVTLVRQGIRMVSSMIGFQALFARAA